MEQVKNNLINSGIIFLLGIILIFPFLNPEFLPVTIGISTLIISLFLLLKQGLALNLMFLFIFAGTLFSVDIGFTLKASQVLAIFAFFNIVIQHFSCRDRTVFCPYNYNFFVSTFFPFIIFFISILPSLTMPTLFSDIYEPVSGFRFIFNYLFLQLITFSIAFEVSNKQKLKQAIKYCFLSYLLVLSFGFFQQIGYYSGFYDPFDYVGTHSLFVNFYASFLRISPGTFANEFGEILQSCAIFLTAFIFLMKDKLEKKVKLFLWSILVLTIAALLINFTRIAWLVYFLYLIALFFITKPALKIKIFIISSILFLGTVLYFINLETGLLEILPVLDRFSELSDLSANTSAGLRWQTWEESYKLFLESPFIGNGLGTTIETHNVPLELLSETGIIGFCGYSILMFSLFLKFYKMSRVNSGIFLKTVAISITFTFLGCLIFDLTNHGLYHFILWLTIGLGLATERIIRSEGEVRPQT